jgi:NTP pyrophosphatase (non-canonical NTP hydrolase)
MNEFKRLADEIRRFAQARDWEQFHTSKNLAMAISGEAGELSAEFQWLSSDQSERSSLSPEKLKAIALEIADVQIYLLRLADVLSIDIPEFVKEKLATNESRFPI